MKRFKIFLTVAICAFLCSATYGGRSGQVARQTASAATKSEVIKKAYKRKLSILKKKDKYLRGIASVQLKCGKGEKILVVTPKEAIYGNGQTTEVDIYQYADGKVKHVGSVESFGTAYPIAYTKKAVLYGSNHCDGRLVIKEGKGTLYSVINRNIYGIKAERNIYSVKNGNFTLLSSKKLSEKKASAKNYYCTKTGKPKGKTILFKK